MLFMKYLYCSVTCISLLLLIKETAQYIFKQGYSIIGISWMRYPNTFAETLNFGWCVCTKDILVWNDINNYWLCALAWLEMLNVTLEILLVFLFNGDLKYFMSIEPNQTSRWAFVFASDLKDKTLALQYFFNGLDPIHCSQYLFSTHVGFPWFHTSFVHDVRGTFLLCLNPRET